VSNRQSSTPPAVAWWIVFCAFCNCAGWILSAIQQLNVFGYGIAFGAGAVVVFVLRKRLFPGTGAGSPWRKARRRFRRVFPLGFLVLAAMVVLGGTLYAPNNYDAMAYRLPRILHWLAAGRWHWVHTDFGRLNVRASGIEWVSVPLMLFTASDRLLFLINVASLLLLPGLVFSVFTRLGVRPRVAWYWMWLLPTGYCFLLQAGGIANDLFGAVFPLAAVDLALRARRSQKVSQLWLSILAAAMVTSSKTSNLPLLLPWVVAVVPCVGLLRRKVVATLGVCLAAGLVSVLPNLVMNVKYGGDWTGISVEHVDSVQGFSALRVANNALLMTMQNLVPPVFPLAGAWNHAMERVEPAAWRAKMESLCEPQSAHWELVEMQMEEDAGLGFGVSLLLLGSLIGGLMAKGGRPAAPGWFSGNLLAWGIILSTLLSLVVFTAKTGMSGPVRHAAPYYALLIPAVLLTGNQVRVVRARLWKWAGVASFGLAGLVVILSPARPLWPALTVLRALGFDHSDQRVAQRTWTVYSVYRQRPDAFAPVRRLLPDQVKRLGFVSSDDPESALWRPYGTRWVLHICAADSPQETQQRGIDYALVSLLELTKNRHMNLEAWLKANDFDVVQRFSLRLRASAEPRDWLLVKRRYERRTCRIRPNCSP
jgi:hypothetical protein